MSHKKGAHLDGIVTLDDLRQRCVVDEIEDGGCWHLRGARGQAMPKGKRHIVWSHVHGSKMTATRLAWSLKNPGRVLRNGWIAFRTCDSYDCVYHISAANKQTWGRHMAASGKATTPAKTIAARAVVKVKQKLTPELKQWLLESRQSGAEAAHALGITQSRANCIRAAHRKAIDTRPAASIFEFAMRYAA